MKDLAPTLEALDRAIDRISIPHGEQCHECELLMHDRNKLQELRDTLPQMAADAEEVERLRKQKAILAINYEGYREDAEAYRKMIAAGSVAWRRNEFGNWHYSEDEFYEADSLYALPETKESGL